MERQLDLDRGMVEQEQQQIFQEVQQHTLVVEVEEQLQVVQVDLEEQAEVQTVEKVVEIQHHQVQLILVAAVEVEVIHQVV